MKKRIAILALVLLTLVWAPVTAADKVIISYSSRSYAFLPAQIAVVKGFFKDENLEPLLIQMRSQVTVPALLSGGIETRIAEGNCGMVS
jgi:ABC-type nitrate/sulfonate/bicarbonate transport system substrate-binding protein